ncbi:MAG: AraC family transcriptional regulator [Clostridia bacterium]|nr:AraC family transcriptional regulator [Clostridia bacterium]
MFIADVPDQFLAWCENKPKLTDLFPVMVGHEVCKKDKEPNRRRNIYYLLHYVKSGSGYLKDNSGTHLISGGSCFLIRPDESVTYFPNPNDPWEYIWVGFSGKLASRFDYIPGIFNFPSPLFLEMLDAVKESAEAEMFVTSLLYKLYAVLFSEKQSVTSDIKSHHVKTVVRYLDYNFMNDISIDEIAKRHNLNRNYLSQIFKEQVGTTMQEYRLKKRLAEAYDLLSKGTSVTEAGNMVGYNDISVFSRAFKKFYGKSPGAVKKKAVK